MEGGREINVDTSLMVTVQHTCTAAHLLCSLHIFQILLQLSPSSAPTNSYTYNAIHRNTTALGRAFDLRGQELLAEVMRWLIEF